ncbi:MAG: aminotransferase class V-fold PLP-dependent enzyme [Crocinitomicaceae bacterium]
MKDLFLLNPEINYLNHGSFGACPKEVFDVYQNFQRELEADSVQFMTKTGVAYLDESKQALADFVNCPKEDLVYVTNPSWAMNVVIKSLDLQEGDEILSTDQEYGAVDRAFNFICKKTGAKYVRQKISLPLVSKEQFIEEFWKGLSSKTKVVCLSQITSATALIFPVKEICEKAKELGLMTIVDGAHVPAHIPLDLSDLKADVYTGACHKWMLAPKGSSFMYASKEVQNNFDPLIISWGYEAQYPSDSQFQDYHQYQGTRDFSAFLTTTACLAFMEKHNWKEKTKEARDLLKHYYPIVAAELNSAPICKISDEFLGQICSIPIKTNDPHLLKETLFNEYKIEIPVMNNVGPIVYTRMSFQPYNGAAEIEDLLNAIRSIKQKTNLIS